MMLLTSFTLREVTVIIDVMLYLYWLWLLTYLSALRSITTGAFTFISLSFMPFSSRKLFILPCVCSILSYRLGRLLPSSLESIGHVTLSASTSFSASPFTVTFLSLSTKSSIPHFMHRPSTTMLTARSAASAMRPFVFHFITAILSLILFLDVVIFQ